MFFFFVSNTDMCYGATFPYALTKIFLKLKQNAESIENTGFRAVENLLKNYTFVEIDTSNPHKIVVFFQQLFAFLYDKALLNIC